MKLNLAILGSTGSIGKSLLNIILKDKKKFKISLLTANSNYQLILEQAKKFNVKNIIITDKKYFDLARSKNKISPSNSMRGYFHILIFLHGVRLICLGILILGKGLHIMFLSRFEVSSVKQNNLVLFLVCLKIDL